MSRSVCVFEPASRVGGELAIEIGFRKPPELRFQFRRHGPRNAQRIDLGDQVSPHAVVADQEVDAFLHPALGVRFPGAVGVRPSADRPVSPLPAGCSAVLACGR